MNVPPGGSGGGQWAQCHKTLGQVESAVGGWGGGGRSGSPCSSAIEGLSPRPFVFISDSRLLPVRTGQL